jgi:hypothetical protein
MSPKYLALIALLALAACKDEEEPLTIEFWANCTSCMVSHGINGNTLGTDSIGGTPARRWFTPAFVGDEVFITAQPRTISNGATGVSISIRNVQQDFQFIVPSDSTVLNSSVTVRITVPDVDRFGQPK